MRNTFNASIAIATLALGVAACGAEDSALAPQPIVETAASPILVSAMMHIDPLPLDDDALMLRAYRDHREAIQWYVGLAEDTGLTISAQMVGIYAEACVRQGHEADFASFMPGGPHHLGTHLHAHIHGEGEYAWQMPPEQSWQDPETVKRIFDDQIPWINRVFEGAGGEVKDNWLFHGTHAQYMEMMGPLLRQDGSVDLSYDNTYRACGAQRGITYLHRGACYSAPDSEGPFVRISEVGGIVGYDREHGPEGMVYGTLPYQRRDFLRVYLDWREGVRRGEPQGIRHFNWMVHPFDLTMPRGTGELTPRETIEALVAWLGEHFVDKADDTGATVARFANNAAMVDAYSRWEEDNPDAAAAQSAALAAAGKDDTPRSLFLPAIHKRLETTYHDAEVSLDPDVVAHRFIDRDAGDEVHVLFARGDTVSLELGASLPAKVTTLAGDGTTTTVSETLEVGPAPIVVEAAR